MIDNRALQYQKYHKGTKSIMHYADITPRHTKAARMLLGWSQGDLAERAALGGSTVKRLEAKEEAMRKADLSTKAAMYNALSAVGIEFSNGGEPGARLRNEPQPLATLQPGAISDG